MRKNERTQAAMANQDNRILSSRSWFLSPRQVEKMELNGRVKETLRRILDGSVRAIEGMRGVRLPLVPRPGPWDCLLQGL